MRGDNKKFYDTSQPPEALKWADDITCQYVMVSVEEEG